MSRRLLVRRCSLSCVEGLGGEEVEDHAQPDALLSFPDLGPLGLRFSPAPPAGTRSSSSQH